MPLDTYQLPENRDGLDEARFTIRHRFTGIIGEQPMPEIPDHHNARRTVRSRDMPEPPHWWRQGLSATGSRARPLASVPDHDTAIGGPRWRARPPSGELRSLSRSSRSSLQAHDSVRGAHHHGTQSDRA